MNLHPPQPDQVTADHHWVRGLLVILQVLYGLYLPLWFIVLIGLFMGFDAPSAKDDRLLQTLVWAHMAYPLVYLVTAVLSWYLYKKGRRWSAFWCNLVPVLWIAPLLLAMAGFSLLQFFDR